MRAMYFSCSDFSEYCIKTMTIKKILYGIVMLFLFNPSVNGQEVISTIVNSSARNSAMANANISEIYDVSGMYENPSSIIYLKNSDIILNHTQMKNNLGMLENLAFPVLPAGPVMIAFGFDLYHLGYLSQYSTLTDQHILEYGYDIAAAYAVSPTFSVGASASLRLGKTGNSQKWAAFYSLGIDYFPSADITYGVVLKSIGNGIQYSNENKLLQANGYQLPKRLEIGATMRYPSASSLRRAFFKMSLANEKIFNRSGLFYKGGIEILPFDFLQLRFGYLVGPNISETRMGFGLTFDNIILEYAVYPHEISNVLQQFSLSMNI